MRKAPPGEVAKETNLRGGSERESHSANLSRFESLVPHRGGSDEEWKEPRTWKQENLVQILGPRYILVLQSH